MDQTTEQIVKNRLIEQVQWHLAGLKQKVAKDFSEASYLKELADLKSDQVYQQFGLACPEYVLVRLMGRMSISISMKSSSTCGSRARRCPK